MAINHSRENGVLVLRLEGRLDSLGAEQLRQDFDSVIEADDRAVVLNMQRLEYVNSAGMRAILELNKNLQSQNARFAIYSLIGSAKQVFQISGFDRVITICASKDEAIAAVTD